MMTLHGTGDMSESEREFELDGEQSIMGVECFSERTECAAGAKVDFHSTKCVASAGRRPRRRLGSDFISHRFSGGIDRREIG